MKKILFCFIIIFFVLISQLTTVNAADDMSDKVKHESTSDGLGQDLENIRVIRNAFTDDDKRNMFQNYAAKTDLGERLVRGAAGSDTVIGLIYDENTGENISSAQITILEMGVAVFSDVNGKFNLVNVPSGEYTFIVEADGYKKASFKMPVSSIGGINIYSLPLSIYYDTSKICEEGQDIESKGIEAQIVPCEDEETEASLTEYTIPELTKFTVLYNGNIYEFGANINDYLYYVVSKEMYVPEANHYSGMTDAQKLEGFKAQAVAARTYATSKAIYGNHKDFGYNFCSTVCCQMYCPWYTNSLSVQAVDDTTNQIVYDIVKNRRCDTFFFDSCKGQTKSYKEVWGNNQVSVSYLVPVSCPYDLRPQVFSGHGVGMCQDGAMGYAKQNYSYIDILAHYYTGTSVITANPCTSEVINVGETKRFSLTSGITKEIWVYLNSPATYVFGVFQAGSITFFPDILIYDSNGSIKGGITSYGTTSITLPKGEYKIRITPINTADVRVSVMCDQQIPLINSAEWETHYVNGTVSKIYRFQPNTSGTYIFETAYFKTYCDTILILKNSAGVEIARNDDWGTSLYSRVSASLVANTTYYIVVGHCQFDSANSMNSPNINCILNISKQ